VAPGTDEPVPTLPIYSYTHLPPSPPARLQVPALGIDSKLVRLALDAKGKMQVPQGADYHLAGWFTGGPEPGQLGPAIIAGHVDSRSGPSIFYRLHELKPGDVVRVTRADGRRLEFVVTERRQYPKADLPAQDVFGPVPWPALRLVTCGGDFDRRAGSYRDNVVVSTRLKGT
jgi:sortase (surface protein transpeptidase)